MKIRKQPSGFDFQQPLLNKALRVHVALMYTAWDTDSGSGSSTRKTYYDAKTRAILDWSNWRVKLIRRFGR